MVVALQVVSVAALLTWTRLFDGELAAVYADAARDTGPLLAGVGGVLFLVVNGLVEDSLFFGVLLSAASRTLPTWAALALSASVFGLAHLHGIPNGAVGVVMAGLLGRAARRAFGCAPAACWRRTPPTSSPTPPSWRCSCRRSSPSVPSVVRVPAGARRSVRPSPPTRSRPRRRSAPGCVAHR